MTDHLRSIRRSLQFLVLVALFATAYFTRELILPVLLGFLLALTLSPISRWMFRLGIPHGASAALLIIAATLVILAVVFATASTVAAWSDDLPGIMAELRAKLRGIFDTMDEVRNVTEGMGTAGAEPATDEPQQVVLREPGVLDTVMNTLTTIGTTLIVTLILALFLLSSGQLFYRKVVQVFPTLTGKKKALNTIYNVEKRVSRYLLTITVINACLGVAIGAYLTALGMPSGYVWGIAAFMLNYLPYIGAVIGTLLVGGLAIVTFDTLGYAMLAPIGYQILTGIEGNIITPLAVGRRLKMNTVAVFLTVIFWAWLWGVPGALIAVPVLVVFKVICENFEALETVGIFLSGEDEKPVPEDEEVKVDAKHVEDVEAPGDTGSDGDPVPEPSPGR